MRSWNDRNGTPDHVDGVDEMDNVVAVSETSFPDPWDGNHAIVYWVWNGEQLVPATPSQQAEIQELERIASARRHVTRWQREHDQQHMTARIRIVRGIRQTMVGAWQMARHVRPPAAPPLETHRAGASTQHRRDAR